jgi:hypothetical protein
MWVCAEISVKRLITEREVSVQKHEAPQTINILGMGGISLSDRHPMSNAVLEEVR